MEYLFLGLLMLLLGLFIGYVVGHLTGTLERAARDVFNEHIELRELDEEELDFRRNLDIP